MLLFPYKYFSWCFLFFLFMMGGSHAQRLRVYGGNRWATNLTKEIKEAGNNYIGDYVSNSNQNIVNITKLKNKFWSVSVSLEDNFTWSDQIGLWLKRTNSGDSSSFIQGGLSYLKLDLQEQIFISGFSNVRGITVQLKLTDISVEIPVPSNKLFITKIIYTLSEN